jgi:stage III sporulation protein AH
VALNWRFSLLNGLEENSGTSPDSLPVSGTPATDSYFEDARYARAQSRQEAIDLLTSVINDENAEGHVRENAYGELVDYAKITEGESALESVLKAKGFSDCIVYLTKDTATVVVAVESLTDQQSVQILDAVISQTGFRASDVKTVTYP